MRVIAGEYKGRKLLSPDGYKLRPTPEKVREALFSILAAEVDGAVCLDLFAGCGSLGIEALSRGADRCFFVDISPGSISLLRDNLASVGTDDKAQIIRGDFKKAIKTLRENDPEAKIDIAFIDPPFDSGYYDVVMKLLADYDIMRAGGIVVIESDDSRNEHIDFRGFSLGDVRKYGRVRLEFWLRD